MMDAETIRQRICANIPDASVEVDDLTGTHDHFQVRVTSPTFRGKSIVDQHRLVYGALGDAMQADIHALVVRTLAPAP
jgi:stress-induced morphogen